MTKRERLQEILRTMDIPEKRVGDWRWLFSNLCVRNGEHKDFKEAMKLAFAVHIGKGYEECEKP